MSFEEINLLNEPLIVDFIEKNLKEKVVKLALSRKGNAQFPALVYAQINNLQKSEKKLPSYYAARALIPSRALEQSSSEATAALKDISGDRFLDLCCGLGVDSFYLGKKFQSGIALEADERLAAITAHNFQKLKLLQVEVRNQKAKAFLSQYTGPAFDLIYADPDRRDAQGKRQILPEKLQPNIPELLPWIRRHSKRLLIKLSPLFDLAEAEKIFQHELYRLVVVSVDNECKELWVDCIFGQQKQNAFTELKMLRKGQLQTFLSSNPNSYSNSYSILRKASGQVLRKASGQASNSPFPFPYILEPDVAFYKARKTAELAQRIFADQKGGFNHPEGYFFAEKVPDNFPGRVFRVLESFPFQPKKIKKALGKGPLNISKRYAQLSVKEIRSKLGISEGGIHFLLCTTWEKKVYIYLAEQLYPPHFHS